MHCLVLAWLHGNSKVFGLNSLLHINKTHSADICPIQSDSASSAAAHPLPSSHQDQLQRAARFCVTVTLKTLSNSTQTFSVESSDGKQTLHPGWWCLLYT